MIFYDTFQLVEGVEHDFNSLNFYCYELLNPLKDMQPFYVGKGTRNRLGSHKYKTHYSNYHKNYTISKILNAHQYVPAKVVFSTANEDDAYNEETRLIALYGTQYDGTGILTNMTKGGRSAPGIPRLPIRQYNLYGEHLQLWPSAYDAAESLGEGFNLVRGILECIRGAKCTAGDFYWSYEDSTIQKYRTKILPVEQLTPNGIPIARFTSAAEAGRALECDGRDLQAAIKRNGASQGYRWRYWEFPALAQ